MMGAMADQTTDAGDGPDEHSLDLAGPPADPLDALVDGEHPRKAAARDWADAALGSAPDTFDPKRWKVAADAGFLRLLAPIEHGGLERSVVDALLSFEGLGAGTSDNGLAFGLASQTFAMQRALSSAGSADQLDRWLGPLLAGDAIGSFAMTEPDAGSDTSTIATIAEPDGNGYRLTGHKAWVTMGPHADVVVVFATTDPSKGRWGHTAFLVDTSRTGVERSAPVERMGLNGAPFGDITFDGVSLSEQDLLGPVGAGGSIFSAAVEAERAFLYGPQLGATERLLNAAIDRATSRVQNDTPIGAHQAVAHRLVDVKVALDASRLLVYRAAVLADRGESVTLAAALAKLQTSESSVSSAIAATTVFGAEGYTTSGGIEAELRHAMAGLNYAGTSDIQRNIAARLLGIDRNRPRTGPAT